MNGAVWFYSLPGVHDHARPEVPRPKIRPEPSIEDMGRGWFRVHGGEHGPVDRYGRENAEQTLAAIKEER